MVDPLILGAVGAGLAVGIAGLGSGIGAGITGASGAGVVAEDPNKFGTAIVFQALPQTQGLYGFLVAILILFVFKTVSPWAMFAAGLAAGLAGLSAIGQGIAASAGLGAVAEDNSIFGKAMVFSVLPETQAIYGLLIAILLLVGVFKGNAGAETVAALGAGFAVGFAGLSGIGQGITAAGAIGATARDPDAMGKGLVLAVMPETFAIFGLLIAILIMLMIK
ncbi:H+-transporting ATP synthase, subunit K (atpK) [Methanocaldococcus jannaschii DSM 2661]|jgi:V/A-type H+-transporting ATPase subunit K|uniref:A-type ATP synthase subunit K n=1 Tax=Methanocaldococcus jannaschii (strain ATCC 43067 / DSM 2661 / JAL-1 / JCM 10045 / NBRC 100440) TaxID=243232 RepID=AATK_METJA|nr:ATP synthase subunit K [Methanocaldococcus jannaschii]Q57674.1 RecName: Full=Probable ATPase proteolipid chain [Methanocaldococcus jannaschii DSM 2661]AAB98207.1 H+-transporting ATP synthase, subunit K (atpK) [Methanocaldococcus jannaschii DSM 2661]